MGQSGGSVLAAAPVGKIRLTAKTSPTGGVCRGDATGRIS